MLLNSALHLQHRISAAIATGAELDSVLSLIVLAAARLCRAEIAAISCLTESREELEVTHVFGTSAAVVGERIPLSASLNGLAVGSGRGVRSFDLVCDERSAIPLSGTARGVLAVPQRGPGGVLGTLAVAKRTPWRFTDQDEAVLFQLSDYASIATQNTRLRQREVTALPAAVGDQSRIGPTLATQAARRGNGACTDVPEKPAPRLSTRQSEIIRLLIAGKTSKETAAALGISSRTVEHHIERLKKRFGQERLPALVGYMAMHHMGSLTH